MKKIAAVLLISAAISLSLAGCGGSPAADSASVSSSSSAVSAEQTAEEDANVKMMKTSSQLDYFFQDDTNYILLKYRAPKDASGLRLLHERCGYGKKAIQENLLTLDFSKDARGRSGMIAVYPGGDGYNMNWTCGDKTLSEGSNGIEWNVDSRVAGNDTSYDIMLTEFRPVRLEKGGRMAIFAEAAWKKGGAIDDLTLNNLDQYRKKIAHTEEIVLEFD